MILKKKKVSETLSFGEKKARSRVKNVERNAWFEMQTLIHAFYSRIRLFF